ncbi:MAG: pyruvate, water dikinase regulatory protein [Candidatus Zixiibacteriota bacterium]
MPPKVQIRYIWIISDGSGFTGDRVLQASLVQFESQNIEIKRIPNVKKVAQIKDIVKKASQRKGLIAYTLVTPKLRREIATRSNEFSVPTVDLLGPLLTNLSTFLASAPGSKPGLLSDLDHHYFKRIDAVGFAVKHDDGLKLQDLLETDLVLIGVSRTSKTPLSMFLAYNKGLLVANIPLILGHEPPPPLFKIDPKKVVGLTINPELLIKLRQSRLAQLTHTGIKYADPGYVREELKYSHDIFHRNPRWAVIDITGKAIEEMAEEACSMTVDRFK